MFFYMLLHISPHILHDTQIEMKIQQFTISWNERIKPKLMLKDAVDKGSNACPVATVFGSLVWLWPLIKCSTV